jgi:hypothetical protein
MCAKVRAAAAEPLIANGMRPSREEMQMLDRSSIHASAAVAALLLTVGVAQAFDDAKYPDLKGRWERAVQGAPRFDPSKSRAEQNPPLTPEARKIFDASVKDIEAGGQGDHPIYRCLAWGMPAMMTLYGVGMEIVVKPDVTYMIIDDGNDSVRRIFTDGRDFSKTADPSFVGYSVGQWTDTDGDGKYDTLTVETRNFKGPRAYDNSGLILHADNQSIIKERIFMDKTKPGVLHDEITVTDHALTRPWVVLKDYKRDASPKPVWDEDVCVEGNQHVHIGGQNYMLSADGFLMPAKKGQQPPDLKYFKQTAK